MHCKCLLIYMKSEKPNPRGGKLTYKMIPWQSPGGTRTLDTLLAGSVLDTELVSPFPLLFLFIGANIFPCQVCSLLITLCVRFSFGPFWLLPLYFDQRHRGILHAPFHEGVRCGTYIKLSKALSYGSHIPNKNVLCFIQNLPLQI